MPHLKKGITSKQAHVAIPEGTFEEEHGRDGFYGPVSHLYHKNSPTNWVSIEGPCKPVAFNTEKFTFQGEPVRFLYNRDVAMYMHHLAKPDLFYSRNADGDWAVFVHAGKGVLETDYGPLAFTCGDYLIIPRGTTYRLVPEGPCKFLMVESASELKQPDRGLLGQHALYDPASIEIPEPVVMPSEKSRYEVRIKRNGVFTQVIYPYHPLDVAGWKGTLFPWKLNIRDFRPVMSHRGHLAPSVHSTLIGNQFVICSFVPRPLEEEQGAQRVPFWHRNIDYDEVIFYHAGNFFSRDGISAGMVTFHPLGIHHGPHPKAYENQHQKDRTDEYAVMLDARNPLTLDPAISGSFYDEYWSLWKTR